MGADPFIAGADAARAEDAAVVIQRHKRVGVVHRELGEEVVVADVVHAVVVGLGLEVAIATARAEGADVVALAEDQLERLLSQGVERGVSVRATMPGAPGWCRRSPVGVGPRSRRCRCDRRRCRGGPGSGRATARRCRWPDRRPGRSCRPSRSRPARRSSVGSSGWSLLDHGFETAGVETCAAMDASGLLDEVFLFAVDLVDGLDGAVAAQRPQPVHLSGSMLKVSRSRQTPARQR